MTQDKQEPKNPYPSVVVNSTHSLKERDHRVWQEGADAMKPLLTALHQRVKDLQESFRIANDLAQQSQTRNSQLQQRVKELEEENTALNFYADELTNANRQVIDLTVKIAALESQLKSQQARPTTEAREKVIKRIAEIIVREMNPSGAYAGGTDLSDLPEVNENDVWYSQKRYLQLAKSIATDQIFRLLPFPDEQGIAKRIFKDLDFAIKVGANKFIFFKDDYNKIQDKYCKAGEPPQGGVQ